MLALRSVLFNLAFFGLTPVLAVASLPTLLGPPSWSFAVGALWGRMARFLLRWIVGLRIEVRGTVPRPPMLIAAKHQSALDTLILPVLLGDPVFVLKRELLAMPIIGWHFRHAGMIAVDRKAGAAAMRGMMRDAAAAVARGRSVVIFPEGTRTSPGERMPYQPGIAALYAQLGVPVVPVALNSGVFWGRRSWLKRPGLVVIEFLPSIAPGGDRRAFVRTLEASIEGATAVLVAEAHRPRPAGA
jgi:1-acyl-sn-glycerol-3-phosphate acyltransferase